MLEIDTTLIPQGSKVCFKLVYVPNDIDQSDPTMGGGTGSGGTTLEPCTDQELTITHVVQSFNQLQINLNVNFSLSGVASGDVQNVNITPVDCVPSINVNQQTTSTTAITCVDFASQIKYLYTVKTTNCQKSGCIVLDLTASTGFSDSQTVNLD